MTYVIQFVMNKCKLKIPVHTYQNKNLNALVSMEHLGAMYDLNALVSMETPWCHV
jgi:RNA polymerase-interacting CarD/CdnL/TRCF family regulator